MKMPDCNSHGINHQHTHFLSFLRTLIMHHLKEELLYSFYIDLRVITNFPQKYIQLV